MRSIVLLASLLAASAVRGDEPASVGDASKLLEYRDQGQPRPVKSANDWAKRRAQILANMERVMGPMPTLAKPPLDVKIESKEEFPKFTRTMLTFSAGPTSNRVSAYLLVPKNLTTKTPAVLCLHPTSKALGKGVPAGLGPKSDRHYAVHLAERGYIALAPDYVHSGGYKFDPYDNGYVSATMLGVWNHRVALDLLETLPQVDRDNIGVIGHSLGGHNSLFVAAFDPRIKAVVTSCGYCSFATYDKGDLAGWSHAGYMPRIKSVYGARAEKMPFDFPEVLAAIAPRAVLTVAPLRDHNFDAGGAKACVAAAMPVFELLTARDKLSAIYPNAGHDFPDDARATAYAFFDRWLKNSQ